MIGLITQILFVISTFIMLPASVLGLCVAKFTGQIETVSTEDEISPFKKGNPNPFVNQNMPWYAEQQKLLSSLEPLTTENLTSNVKEIEKEEDTSQSSRLIMTFQPLGEKKKEKESLKTKNEKVETRGRPPTPVFKTVDYMFEAEVSKDFEGKTEDGIPFRIKKGTKIRVVVPSAKHPEFLKYLKNFKVEKEEVLENLEEDEDLGVVVG